MEKIRSRIEALFHDFMLKNDTEIESIYPLKKDNEIVVFQFFGEDEIFIYNSFIDKVIYGPGDSSDFEYDSELKLISLYDYDIGGKLWIRNDGLEIGRKCEILKSFSYGFYLAESDSYGNRYYSNAKKAVVHPQLYDIVDDAGEDQTELLLYVSEAIEDDNGRFLMIETNHESKNFLSIFDMKFSQWVLEEKEVR